MNLKHRQTCRVCGNPHLADVIDLGDQFLQGSFVKDGMTKPTVRKIPTKLVRCDTSKNENGCGLVQMSVTVPPSILYSNYWYQSGISKTMKDHLKEIVDEVVKLVNPKQVLDIAANDLTLLKNYAPEVGKVAIDPSDILRRSTLENTHAINDLFPTKKLPAGILFDVITTIAMFYDLEDPVEFVKEVNAHLAADGVWVVEVAYLPDTLKQVSYDTIVSEHLEMYSLSSLEYILKEAGLRAFKAELNPINGGSIKLFACKEGCFKYDSPENSNHLMNLRIAEFDLKLDTDEPYEMFRSKVRIQRDELRNLIKGILAEGKVIHQYGSSTKANTLLQYCGLNYSHIPYAAERSPEKWGARTLGTNIQIISEEESRAMKPDYYLVGPWHFKDEILKREADTIRSGIKFIFPLPNVTVVGNS